MSIFSKLARKDEVHEQKKATSAQNLPKSPQVQTKYVPTFTPAFAAIDPWSAGSTPFRPEELQAVLEAARKKRKEISAPMTLIHTANEHRVHSRAKSDVVVSTREIAERQDHTCETMTLNEVPRSPPRPPPRPQTYHPAQVPSIRRPRPEVDQEYPVPPLPKQRAKLTKSRSLIPRKQHEPGPRPLPNAIDSGQLNRDFVFRSIDTQNAFSNPRDVPMPPPMKHLSYHAISTDSYSTINTVTSPRLNTSFEQEPHEYFSASSQESAFSATSSETSSMTSKHKRSPSGRITSMMPTLPKPKSPNHKQHNDMQISLPYVSRNDHSKTAKSTIPTWRYDDLPADCEPPVLVKTISGAHSRGSSRSSIFHRRHRSISVP